jgi:hypothetical protein
MHAPTDLKGENPLNNSGQLNTRSNRQIPTEKLRLPRALDQMDKTDIQNSPSNSRKLQSSRQHEGAPQQIR